MFQKGSYVIKTMNKVCRVEDIVKLDSSEKEYYLLIPLEEKGAKIFVPVERTATSVREIMSKEAVMDLIAKIPKIEETYIDNEKLREQKYKEIIKCNNPELLVGIIKMIFLRNRKRTEQGKKSTTIDQKYYKLAEDYLYSEMAFVLKKEKSEIQQIIKDTCENNTY